MYPSLGNPYMRCEATDGLIVLAPSCSALRGSRSRAIRFPSQPQVGPVAKLHWLDRLFGNCRTTEIFKSKYFADVSLDQWMALTPPELVEAHLKLNRQGNGRAAQDQSPVVSA
jgi:hypothetical protein